MRALLPLLIAALALAGCSKRERLNPFDPANPSTQGRPAGFVAIAGNARVTLRWQSVFNVELISFRLFRTLPGDTAYTLIAELPPFFTEFADNGLINSVEHRYRLHYVFQRGMAELPAEDAAVPNPARPWVTDLSGDALLLLTPDARHVAFRDGSFQGPGAVDVDASSGVVWICDTFAGRVVIRNGESGTPTLISGLSSPVAIAVDPTTHTAWVCDNGTNLVRRYGENGLPLGPIFSTAFFDPIAVARDRRDGSLWVCEGFGNKVRHFDSDGTALWGVTIQAPSRVAIDSVTQVGWVTSYTSGRLVRITSTGSPFDTVESVVGPIGIAVDAARGRIWVADAGANRVLALTRAGAEVFRVDGLPGVQEISVDERSGEAWATVPGDGTVVRLAADGVAGRGTVLGRFSGLRVPYGIAVDSGLRFRL